MARTKWSRGRIVVAMAFLTLVALGCSDSGVIPGQSSPSQSLPGNTTGGSEVVGTIAAVGDIACNSFPSAHTRRCRYDQVAKLVEQLHPDKFLALGDLQYLHGSLHDYRTYYDRYFAPLKSITEPVPGNHETYTTNMRGYLQYFGAIARPHGGWSYPNRGGYYSFDLGGWHFIALNSQACKGQTWSPTQGRGVPISSNPVHTNGCGPGSSMYEWLRRDLALHPNSEYPCTVAFFHHPEFAWWPYRQTIEMIDIQPLWQALDEGGVDVVLNGHFHNYQRWAPQDVFGAPEPNGPAEFIVGTGGDTYENDFPSSAPPANLVAHQAHSFGVLQLTMHPDSYDFSFLTAPGERPYDDSGTGVACH